MEFAGLGGDAQAEGVLSGGINWLGKASRSQRYLIGVSGGADSVALLHLLAEAGFKRLVVCHLNHGLRGRESGGDARFVRALAKRLGFEFELKKVDLASLASREKRSLETAGRIARQEFFADCGGRWRCRQLLLAHHADDQAETILWQLIRGSHAAGGMRAEQELQVGRRKLRIFRPLLGARRDDLRDWLRERGLAWREDRSNTEAFAVRNRLRHEGLPLLSEIARRDVVPALLKSGQAASELRDIEDWAVNQAGVLDPQGRIHLPSLRALPLALQNACLFRFLRQQGVPDLDRALMDRARTLVDPSAAPAINLPGGRQLRRRAGRLLIA